MARQAKQGLDYFPLDVNFMRDIKVRKLIRSCGITSIPIMLSLLSNIYRTNGYYIEWDKTELPFLIVDECVGVKEGLVIDTVNMAVRVGLFDKDMFANHNILTSRGIQERFLEATKRRSGVLLLQQYMLSGVNVCNNSINVDNNSINVCKSTQSKVKEIKENKIKELKACAYSAYKNQKPKTDCPLCHGSGYYASDNDNTMIPCKCKEEE